MSDAKITGVVRFYAPWDGGRASVAALASFLPRVAGGSVPMSVAHNAAEGVAQLAAEGQAGGPATRRTVRFADQVWTWEYDPTPTTADLAGCEPKEPPRPRANPGPRVDRPRVR